MQSNQEETINFIQALEVSDEEKKVLIKRFKKMQKELTRSDFKLKRTMNDREIAINLLNTTIDDLQKKQEEVAEANHRLIQNKKEIEDKNILLLEQKELLEEQSEILQDHLRKLEISYQELEQFSYIASHDLKSPLRSIAGFAQLLRRKYLGKLGAEADEYIEFIVKGTVHMNEVIRDLLEYSKMGQNAPTFENVNLNEIMGIVVNNLQSELREKNVVLEVTEMPILKVHKTGIIQVFQNLIANGIKFQGIDQPKIIVRSEQRGNYWTFSIQDNGVGLDETYQEKVFLPFQRINGNQIKGTGIGLAICKKVVLMHKGEIWYTSKNQEGTTFYFSIFQQPVGNIAPAEIQNGRV